MLGWTDGFSWQNRTVRDDFDGDGGVILKHASTIITNATGNLTDETGAVSITMPDFSLRTLSALDSRQFQLRFKFNF